MIPPSAFVDGLLQSWPYLAGAIAVGTALGFAVPVQKRHREEVQTIIREEVQNDIKIVTRTVSYTHLTLPTNREV